ncbi:hypothetical protein V6N13_092067 [Hibiscus sabdariffa]|uniref:PGG domain-containing protein n=1 Tax=Hibiscus sabdariffa TaxID=183260 RepID=A0ABR2QFU2_9ROSI
MSAVAPSNLQHAAEDGDVDSLYRLIAEDPSVLDRLDEVPFDRTPLHIAAMHGRVKFAVEIMRLKPSLSRKLDPDGRSPMQMALQNEQIPTVLRFLEMEPDLVRFKGRLGFTPLHDVVKRGNLQLLREFLAASPHSITDTTSEGETALHIAVRSRKTVVLDFLLSFLRRSWYREALYWEDKILNWKDQDGSTVLHTAVRLIYVEGVRLLLKCNIHVNALDLQGLTALDVCEHREMEKDLIRAGALTSDSMTDHDTAMASMKQLSFESRLTLVESMVRFLKGQKTNISTESCDALLVVAALVATASFQAVLSPPGGLRQADSSENDVLPFGKAGKVVMKQWLYIIFLILNATSFWVTIVAIYLLLPSGFYGHLLTLPLALFSASYLFCSTVISPSIICVVVNFGFFTVCVVLLLVILLHLSKRRMLLPDRK